VTVNSISQTTSINTRITEPPIGTPPTITETEFPIQFAASRLPKLSLPMFSGNSLEWLTFWDSFRAVIHLNPSLVVSSVQKLKAQLQGEAAKAIEGFLRDCNYLHAIAILQDRFGQTDILIDAHMLALLELPKPNNSLHSLRSFHDTVKSHTHGLSSLGKSAETYGDLLVTVIQGKLPKDIKINIARSKITPESSLPQLMSAILKEISILEYGAHNSSMTQSTATFLSGAKFNQAKKPDKGQPSCVFCKGAHATRQCTVITDHQQCLDIVK